MGSNPSLMHIPMNKTDMVHLFRVCFCFFFFVCIEVFCSELNECKIPPFSFSFRLYNRIYVHQIWWKVVFLELNFSQVLILAFCSFLFPSSNFFQLMIEKKKKLFAKNRPFKEIFTFIYI